MIVRIPGADAYISISPNPLTRLMWDEIARRETGGNLSEAARAALIHLHSRLSERAEYPIDDRLTSDIAPVWEELRKMAAILEESSGGNVTDSTIMESAIVTLWGCMAG